MKYIFLIVFLILNFKAIAAENKNYHCKAEDWNQNIKMSKELFLKTSNHNNRAVLVVNYKSFNQNQVDEIKSWEELDDDVPLEAQELIEVEKENRANTSSEEQD